MTFSWLYKSLEVSRKLVKRGIKTKRKENSDFSPRVLPNEGLFAFIGIKLGHFSDPLNVVLFINYFVCVYTRSAINT